MPGQQRKQKPCKFVPVGGSRQRERAPRLLHLHDCIAEVALVAVRFVVGATERHVFHRAGRFRVAAAVNLQNKKP